MIVNKLNKKIYIGSSENLKRRKNAHFNKLNSNKHKNIYLQRSYNKYGEENFNFEIIEECEDKTKLLEREQFLLDIYFDNCKNCYNICPIAGSTFGVKRNKETKLKLSIINGGKPFYVLYDKKIIKECINQTECAKELKLCQANITSCLNGKRNQTGNYVFIYKDEYNEDKVNDIYKKIDTKPFNVYKKDTHEFVGSYVSQRKCAKELRLSVGNLNECLRGSKVRKSCGGYIFNFIA